MTTFAHKVWSLAFKCKLRGLNSRPPHSKLHTLTPQLYTIGKQNYVCAGFRLNNAWANGTVLRPCITESPLSSQEFGLRLQVHAPGFELMTPLLGVERSSPSAIHHPRQNYVLMSFGNRLLDVMGTLVESWMDPILWLVEIMVTYEFVCKTSTQSNASKFSQVVTLDSVEILDLDTLTWSTGASMPTAVEYGTGHSFNGKFIVVGGRNVTDYLE